MEEVKELGKYIVAHPGICHGKPTFRGTRIMVWQVLEMVADGMDWDEISCQWSGRVSREAIAEAILAASDALLKYETRRPLGDEANQKVKNLGEYIVADPHVCHGKPTFGGTRIMVWQVLKMVAKGRDWEAISNAWEGRVKREAIVEAIRVASEALLTHETRQMAEPELACA
jgi:uncharacterized protein (DUF433 family)